MRRPLPTPIAGSCRLVLWGRTELWGRLSACGGLPGRGCLALILAAACCAQTPPPPLTLQDAEALAIKNHPQVQAAQLNYQASQQAVAEARSAYFPTLQGDITGSQGNPQARIGAGYLVASRVWDRFRSEEGRVGEEWRSRW